jgi:hypothetical protein
MKSTAYSVARDSPSHCPGNSEASGVRRADRNLGVTSPAERLERFITRRYLGSTVSSDCLDMDVELGAFGLVLEHLLEQNLDVRKSRALVGPHSRAESE